MGRGARADGQTVRGAVQDSSGDTWIFLADVLFQHAGQVAVDDHTTLVCNIEPSSGLISDRKCRQLVGRVGRSGTTHSL